MRRLICGLLLVCLAAHAEQAPLESRLADALAALPEQRLKPFEQLLDMDALGLRVLDGMDASTRESLSFLAGFRQAEKQFVGRTAEQLATTEHIQHLWTRPTGDHQDHLYRFDLGEEGFSYQQYRMHTATEQIIDIFDYANGSWISDSMRLAALSLLGANSLVNRMSSLFDEDAAAEVTLGKMVRAMAGQDFGAAMAVYRNATESFKNNETAQALLANAIAQTNDPLYSEGLSLLGAHASDNPRFTFILLDYHYLNGDFPRALESVRALQKELDVVESGMLLLEASVLMEMGDYDSAIAVLERSAGVEPNRIGTYEVLLGLYAGNGRFEDAARINHILQDRFDSGWTVDELLNSEDLHAFGAWLRERSAS